MKLNSLITFLITENITEAAISIQEAQNQNLALQIDNPKKGFVRAILYDPTIVKQNLKSLKSNSRRNLFLDAIYAFIIVEPIKLQGCENIKNTSAVQAVAAKKGYGPLIYDITLSSLHPIYLTSDRSSVSNDAFNIWNYYFFNRSHNVIAKPLPINCTLPKQFQDLPLKQNPLAHKYQIAAPINFASLTDNHIQLLNSANKNINLIKTYIAKAGISFFLLS